MKEYLQNDVLGSLLLAKWSDDPIGGSVGTIVVSQCSNIFSWFIESDSAIGFGSNPDDRRSMSVLGKEILIPREIPPLNSWLSNLEVRCSSLCGCTSFRNGEGEICVRDTSIGFRSIDWRVNFQSNVKVLA